MTRNFIEPGFEEAIADENPNDFASVVNSIKSNISKPLLPIILTNLIEKRNSIKNELKRVKKANK